MKGFSRIVGAACVWTVLSAAWAHAVILYNSAARNITPPAGAYADSGWQLQGNWNGFLGTPISPKHFITAGHVGGSVGQTFSLNGINYTTVGYHDDPDSDLRIWTISGTFERYAPLYNGGSEKSKSVILYGRGTQRGDAVSVNDIIKGWTWGASDRVKSWGFNQVTSIGNGGVGLGQLLKMNFDARTNEGTLSNGDSGGGVFINDNGTWKLAGINYATDGPYSHTGTTGSGFHAAIFDKGGLYTGKDEAWNLNSDTADNIPAASYATRISSNMPWIRSVIGPQDPLMSAKASAASAAASAEQLLIVPEPGTIGLLAIGAYALLCRRRRPSR